MKIIVNTASTFEGGAIQVAKSFIEECRDIEHHTYYVILGVKFAPHIDQGLFPNNFHFYSVSYRPASRVFSLRSTASFFQDLEAEVNPDVVFTTSGPAYWKPKAPHLCGFNIPQSVYPESAYFRLIPKRKSFKWKVDRIVRRYFFKRDGEFFVVQTADVNSRLRLWFKTENVATVSNTCSSYYLEKKKFNNKLPPKKGSEFRFLTFSTFRPHKNLAAIKKVIDHLPSPASADVRFVVTIPNDDFESFFPRRYQDFVHNVGPIKVEEGPSLYGECDAMFLPTLLECFSASYPESMAMEKPILTSDLSFARSICKEAAIYFNPLKPEDITSKVLEVINSPELRNDLVKKGRARLRQFGSANDRAHSYIDLLEKIYEKGFI